MTSALVDYLYTSHVNQVLICVKCTCIRSEMGGRLGVGSGGDLVTIIAQFLTTVASVIDTYFATILLKFTCSPNYYYFVFLSWHHRLLSIMEELPGEGPCYLYNFFTTPYWYQWHRKFSHSMEHFRKDTRPGTLFVANTLQSFFIWSVSWICM